MSPEERVALLKASLCFVHHPEGEEPSENECGKCLAAAFVAAENEAWEQAAVLAEDADRPDEETRGWRIADEIRALKHKETP